MLKKYKVFLASSGELAPERKEIAVMISRQNNGWTEKDIYVELVVWEDLLHSFRGDGERIQDYFNEEMLKCDIVIALFYRKVGQFTEEEFKLAYENTAILILTDLRAGFYGYLKNLIPGINLKSFLLNVNKGIS